MKKNNAQLLEINEDMPELDYMTFENISRELETCLETISNDIDNEIALTKKPIKNYGRYVQMVLSKLKIVLGDLDKFPIKNYDEAIAFYFKDSIGFNNTKSKYDLILQLQDYIVSTTRIPFIYDRYTIIKILQITLPTYNRIVNDCLNGAIIQDNEDVANIFCNIETMILNDRNSSAENNNANAKAIDNVNRYKKENGGFGVEIQGQGKVTQTTTVIVSDEEVKKKLSTRFNFIEQTKKQK